MRCRGCGHENPADNAFCGGCGARLALVCASCAKENSPDHRFCGGCGAPLAGPAPEVPVRSLEQAWFHWASGVIAATRGDASRARACELAVATGARDLPPAIEEALADLAGLRNDEVGRERALSEAARLYRENGEERLAAQADERRSR
jgi:hypothetical protein